jgi:hypothetical protein
MDSSIMTRRSQLVSEKQFVFPDTPDGERNFENDKKNELTFLFTAMSRER